MRLQHGLALLALATTCHASDSSPVWSARYQVVFGKTAQGVPIADVNATLQCAQPTEACPESVDVEMADDGLPKGYGSFVREFVTTPADAAQLLFAARAHYRLRVQPGGSVRFRYRVVMTHDPTDWGPGPDEAPYRFEGGAFWTGRALFITAARSRAEIAFEAPAEDRIAVAFEPVRGRVGSYTVPDETRLRDAFLVVGAFRESRLKVGKAVVTLVLGGRLGESMPVVEQAVRRFLDASKEVFRGAPPRRILVVGNLGASRGSLYGGVFGNDVSFLADEPLGTANADRWRPFLCHELFHLWNGSAIDFADGQQYWFSEGVTEYYAHLLPVRLGEVAAERFLQTISAKAASYLAAAGAVSLRTAGDEKFLNNALVYDGGALAALCLDLRVRWATSNRKSLDDVLRALYKTARGRRGKGLTYDDVVRSASSVAGLPMDEFFEPYVEGPEELPLVESLKLAGLRLHAEIAELPETEAILGDLLLCPSASVVPGGLLINVSESARIRPGDVLVAVAGSPIRDFEDLRRAFQDRRPTSQVAIALMRDGKRIDLDVVLGGKVGQSVSRSRQAEVHIEVLPDAEPLPLKIRASLLGG